MAARSIFLIKFLKSGRIDLMKNIVGVIVITSVVTLGGFTYYQLTNDKEIQEPDTGKATISEPVATQNTPDDQTPESKEGTAPVKQEENKPLPDLDSLKGLEEESGDLFEGIDSLPGGNAEDPLKDVLE